MPKVEIGDKIKVLRCNAESPWFAGYIHTLEREQVFLRFHHTFVGIRGQLFNIRLELNRLGLRQMHMALETSFYPSRILFPNSNHLTGPSSRNRTQMGDLNVVNKVIEDNRSQLMVVTAILSQPAGSVPFVILGPPGTGKTTTIIEAIKQLLIKDRSTRVLACAPSDGVADLVCQRLMALGRTQIFRLNAPTRPKTTLPPVLKDFCSLNETIFTIPPLEVLKNYRVIVSTCMTAAIPSRVGLPRGHFSHVFVDEAGQASEPEVMIPIKLLGGSESNIIISGDPKNLGPVVSSPVAQRLGLGTSYLERLINLPIYDDRTHHGVTMIKLTDNFRSHPAILKFPNENFYRTELTPCALSTVAESLLRWRGLPRQGFPIVFHAINGKDERQASSASFFNSDEASLVKKYIRDLRSDGRLRLNDSSIGVISSQGSQCMKIRSILRRENPSIKVGIPEEIQGLERRVIIISTVRSSLDFVSYDICHNLGFLAQPRRFNVALTSCQALLIIIGSPNILRLDPLWRSFLNYIHQRGGWKGLPISWDANEDQEIEGLEEAYRKEGMTELEARLKSMVLSALDEEEGGARPGNTDPETQTIFQDGV
ncbi:hypothetical protein FRC03_002138 [Tulasnella sp. 419]|nr:hypothetical protein FRC03_002138 [Tulasnella sp. 419]